MEVEGESGRTQSCHAVGYIKNLVFISTVTKSLGQKALCVTLWMGSQRSRAYMKKQQ